MEKETKTLFNSCLFALPHQWFIICFDRGRWTHPIGRKSQAPRPILGNTLALTLPATPRVMLGPRVTVGPQGPDCPTQHRTAATSPACQAKAWGPTTRRGHLLATPLGKEQPMPQPAASAAGPQIFPTWVVLFSQRPQRPTSTPLPQELHCINHYSLQCIPCCNTMVAVWSVNETFFHICLSSPSRCNICSLMQRQLSEVVCQCHLPIDYLHCMHSFYARNNDLKANLRQNNRCVPSSSGLVSPDM